MLFSARDLHVLPSQPLGPTGAESLEQGFLGGKSDGVMRGRIPASLAEFLLGCGKDSPNEALSLMLERMTDAAYFNHVHSEADNHPITPETD
jgi:hypothetical protein